jgi:hypothetical protein
MENKASIGRNRAEVHRKAGLRGQKPYQLCRKTARREERGRDGFDLENEKGTAHAAVLFVGSMIWLATGPSAEAPKAAAVKSFEAAAFMHAAIPETARSRSMKGAETSRVTHQWRGRT